MRTCRLVALALPDPGRTTGSRPLIHPGSDRSQRVDRHIRFPGLPTHPALLWEGRLKFLLRDADHRDRLRKMIRAPSVNLPILLFEVGQPQQLDQRGNVLANEDLMRQLVSKLRQLPLGTLAPKFHVYGFADGSGRVDQNLELSERRANWAIARLKQDHGLNLELEASGCGDFHSRQRMGTMLNPKQRAVLLMPA